MKKALPEPKSIIVAAWIFVAISAFVFVAAIVVLFKVSSGTCS